MLMIVTGTIKPDNRINDLVLREKETRLSQYRNAMEALIIERPDAKVVFCDNSGAGEEAMQAVQSMAEASRVCFEVLSFHGDQEAVAEHGKGYGEGEIIKYVLKNSKVAADETYMVKMTGRLFIDNIADILRHLKQDRVYFNIPNIHRRDIYDTRIYAMPVEIYRKFFIDAYMQVNDGTGEILEAVFTRIIKQNGIKVRNLPRYPRIRGMSGSSGILYDYREWKCRIRDIFSTLNVYGRVKGAY